MNRQPTTKRAGATRAQNGNGATRGHRSDGAPRGQASDAETRARRRNGATRAQRRDAATHAQRRDGAGAFVPDPSEAHAPGPDDLAEALAESYVSAATSGEQQAEQTLDDFVDEELGGPFVQEDGELDAAPEGFPRLAPSLRPEIEEEPDVLGVEPHPARQSGRAARPRRRRRLARDAAR